MLPFDIHARALYTLCTYSVDAHCKNPCGPTNHGGPCHGCHFRRGERAGRERRQRERAEALRQKESEAEAFDLDELLERLPPETRDLVQRHYLDEIPYAELEKELGLSQAGIRQRLSRAIRTLRGDS